MAGKITSTMKAKVLESDTFSHDDDDDDEDYGLVGLFGSPNDGLNDCVPSLEKLNLGGQHQPIGKKLLVLSLGGLLCHRVYRNDKSDRPTYRVPDLVYGKHLVYKRPHCEDFIKFCFERFEVGIWSSAREWNLNTFLTSVLKGMRSKLLFAWDQDECRDTGFKTLENRYKPIFIKELSKLWKKKFLRGGPYSSSNTLLIDDKPYKALLNPMHTGIFPSEYKGYDLKDDALGPNGELRLYLEKLADADDVQSFVKDHAFGQTSITATHSDWNFYSQVINHLQNTSVRSTTSDDDYYSY